MNRSEGAKKSCSLLEKQLRSATDERYIQNKPFDSGVFNFVFLRFYILIRKSNLNTLNIRIELDHEECQIFFYIGYYLHHIDTVDENF